MAAGRKSDRQFFSISGYLAFNENGLQPIYDEPEEEAAENNEFLKRLKPAKQNFMVWLPTFTLDKSLLVTHLLFLTWKSLFFMSQWWNENGLRPIYVEPEEKAVESNDFLKRLKPAKQIHELITGHLWISW